MKLPTPRGNAPLCACGCGNRTSTVRTLYVLGHRPLRPMRERIEGNYTIDAAGCWIWSGPFGNNRYGLVRYARKRVMAHRAAYEVYVSPIAEGLVIDHLCRVPECINPEHLEPVTPSVNVQRARRPDYAQRRIEALARPCPRGHERTPENVVITNDRLICRPCAREASLRWWYRNRQGRSA